MSKRISEAEVHARVSAARADIDQALEKALPDRPGFPPGRPEAWKPVPGCSHYEASNNGAYRSVDRIVNGRTYKGKVLASRISNRGYVLWDLRNDDGKKVTRTAHTVMLETWAGPKPRGQEACHEDDVPTHNWIENLRWDVPPANVADRMRNHPAAPRPAKVCVRCKREFTGSNGRRCHECVVMIGKTAALLMMTGKSLAEACAELEYPSAEGLHNLAVKYGGYAAPPPRSWSQRVMATVRGWFGRGDSR